MKLAIILIVALTLASLIGCTEPDLTGAYARTPFDRCMASYEGTSNADQCELLKL